MVSSSGQSWLGSNTCLSSKYNKYNKLTTQNDDDDKINDDDDHGDYDGAVEKGDDDDDDDKSSEPCVYHEDASIHFHLTALKIRMHRCRAQLAMGYISLPYFHLDLCKNENISSAT